MRSSTKVIAAGLLATIVGAGVSLAAGDSSNVYSGCYKSRGSEAGTVRLVNEAGTPTSCPNGYTAFSFNQ